MRVFMTGGAGFLGRAVMRRAILFSPDPVHFTVYSRDEAKHMLAREEFPEVTYILGDVRDQDRLDLAMAGHEVVVHMAAMKYVPQGESNVWEAIAVNVDGSRNVALAAAKTGVGQVIGISTDKACRPVNVYGLTKLIMERLFQEADGWSSTQFNVVRYGNVVGSTGSVIPFFRRQAREGQEITITDAGMTRFWLSVNDAVNLIATVVGEHTTGGSILIPRLPAATMTAVALACAMVEGVDKPTFKQIGQRFGEKRHEDLISPEEVVYAVGRSPTVMELFPNTMGPQAGHVEHFYTSNTPDRLLGPGELQAMISDAEALAG